MPIHKRLAIYLLLRVGQKGPPFRSDRVNLRSLKLTLKIENVQFMSPNLSFLSKYENIFLECSFGFKSLLNFTTVQFHNCHHHTTKQISNCDPPCKQQNCFASREHQFWCMRNIFRGHCNGSSWTKIETYDSRWDY